MGMRTGSKTVELIGDILHQTDKAIQFKFEDEDGETRREWFPLSQVDEIHHDEPNRIVVSQWIMSQKQAAWNP